MEIQHIEGFKCPARKFQCKTCNKYGHFTSLCYKKKVSFKSRTPKAHQLQAGQMYMQEDSICGQSADFTSSNESFCLQVKIQCTQASCKIPTTSHLITILVYRLKPHHTRNQYLRARLDTCADLNIMPASVYKLVFQDPDCKKLAPSKLEIGIYTISTVRLVGSCVFYLVHPDKLTSTRSSTMAVFCYLVQPHLHLAWYSIALDWTIFLLEPALLPVVLTIQRRSSPKSVYMYPEKNLKCLQCPTKKVWYPSLLQARNRFL